MRERERQTPSPRSPCPRIEGASFLPHLAFERECDPAAEAAEAAEAAAAGVRKLEKVTYATIYDWEEGKFQRGRESFKSARNATNALGQFRKSVSSTRRHFREGFRRTQEVTGETFFLGVDKSQSWNSLNVALFFCL